jgi:hypothetical protein
MVSSAFPRHSLFLNRHSLSLATGLLLALRLAAFSADPSSPAAPKQGEDGSSTQVSGPQTQAPKLKTGDALDYKIGDIATEEVIAPVSMVVIDPDETIALKQAEAARVQVICRFYTNRAEQVEERFRSAFATTHSNFLDAAQTAFNRQELTLQNIASQKFQRLIGNFQRRNKSFPLTTNLAETWARGESDRVLQSSLSARLREAMIRPIRAGGQPVPKFTFTVRMVVMANDDETLTLEQAEKRGRNAPRANIVALSKAKSDLVESFPPEEQALGKYLASLLKTNLVADMDLTDKARAKRTEPLWAADRYDAGQVIVKQGQVIDRKIKAALNQLREKAAIGSLQERVRVERSNALQAEQRAETERDNAQKAHERHQVELATAQQVGGAVGVALVGVVFYRSLGAGAFGHAMTAALILLAGLTVATAALVQLLPRRAR